MSPNNKKKLALIRVKLDKLDKNEIKILYDIKDLEFNNYRYKNIYR